MKKSIFLYPFVWERCVLQAAYKSTKAGLDCERILGDISIV